MKSLRARNNGPKVQIGQIHLPLSFGLAHVVQSVNGRNLSIEASNSTTDMVHMLASKVLHTPLFTAMDWLSPSIQPAQIFHLARRILKGNASLSSLTMAETIVDIPITQDTKEVAKWRVRLAKEAITLFDAHTSNVTGLTTSYDSPKFVGAAYLFDVATTLAHKCRGI